jgi:hypothetical protein
VAAQLGREPRAMRAVGHRCGCGLPDVVETAPRLPDGTPFPTLYYLTCPRASSAIGRLEAGGLMREMTERLKADGDLAARYRVAHEVYLRRRQQIGDVPEIAGVSAGGMPGRVKCLHVLVAHSLAAGPGINPLGDEALEKLPAWWVDGPCVAPAAPGDGRPSVRSAPAGREAAPTGTVPAQARPRPAGPADAAAGRGSG